MKELLNIQEKESKQLVFINRTDINLVINQYADSHLIINIINIDDQDAHNNISIKHLGKGCQTEIYALTIAEENQNKSLHTNIRHEIGKGESVQLVKFILKDSAIGSFNGRLYVAPDAQQTSAQQTNRNLVLSDKAKMRTQPQLEIYADDVKASHGASTGQLNDNALFYMQQRGISLQTAKQLLVRAFIEDVISKLPNHQREELEILI